MREFNLEEAKAGKPVCTREGYKARIICWDKKGEYPIVALVENDCEVFHESIKIYSMAGECLIGFASSGDLMMAYEKHEGWANVYRTSLDSDLHVTLGNVYSTKEKAERMSRDAARYVTTTKIEWEE